MKWFRLAVAALAALALVGCGTSEAKSSSDAPDALPSYEQWQADVKKVTDPAIGWLQNRSTQGGSKLAIVLDIDNTSLETHYHPGAPNKPVLAIAQWAHSHNYSVLFVTLRDEKNRDAATDQLKQAGYPLDGMCMRTTGDRTKPTCREKLTSSGYTITANIGNRAADFDGANYEKAYQLPDYKGKLE